MVSWLLRGVRESLKVCLNAETLETIWKEKNAISSKREYGSNEFIRGFFTTLHGFVLVSQSAVTRRMTVEWNLNSFFCTSTWHCLFSMIFIQMLSCVKFPNSSHSCPVAADSVDQFYGILWLFPVCLVVSPARADRHAVVLFPTPPGDILPKVQHPSARASGAVQYAALDVGGISGCCNQYSKMDAMVICLVVSSMAFINFIIYGIIHDNPSHCQNSYFSKGLKPNGGCHVKWQWINCNDLATRCHWNDGNCGNCNKG